MKYYSRSGYNRYYGIDMHTRRSRIIRAVLGVVVVFSVLLIASSRLSDHGGIWKAINNQRISVSRASRQALGLATKSPQPAVTHSSRYGLAVGSRMTKLSTAELNTELNDIQSMGIGYVRLDIEWSNVEPKQGVYNWEPTDAVINGIRSRQMQVVAVIDYSPEWARGDSCSNDKCPPADPADYGAFASTVAKHYKTPGIAAYEIWNEPNNSDFFAPASNPAVYVQMLKSAYTAIKQVSPDAKVITGGTSPADTSHGRLSPPDFITAMYANGAKGYFDAIAAHPYTFPVTTTYNNPDNAWGELQAIHSTMIAQGDADKQVWLTEYGAPTGGPGPTATITDLKLSQKPYHVDEALQAKAVTDLASSVSQANWIGPVLWYTYKDSGTEQDTNENFFGLVRADGSQKPAYAAMVQAAKQ